MKTIDDINALLAVMPEDLVLVAAKAVIRISRAGMGELPDTEGTDTIQLLADAMVANVEASITLEVEDENGHATVVLTHRPAIGRGPGHLDAKIVSRYVPSMERVVGDAGRYRRALVEALKIIETIEIQPEARLDIARKLLSIALDIPQESKFANESSS